MPGNPDECRQHALNCRRLAERATSPEARERVHVLAQHWARLAAELENAQAFIRTMETVGEKKTG